jgi:hypothetical protein
MINSPVGGRSSETVSPRRHEQTALLYKNKEEMDKMVPKKQPTTRWTFDSWKTVIVLFTISSRAAFEPNQPPIQEVEGECPLFVGKAVRMCDVHQSQAA